MYALLIKTFSFSSKSLCAFLFFTNVKANLVFLSSPPSSFFCSLLLFVLIDTRQRLVVAVVDALFFAVVAFGGRPLFLAGGFATVDSFVVFLFLFVTYRLLIFFAATADLFRRGGCFDASECSVHVSEAVSTSSKIVGCRPYESFTNDVAYSLFLFAIAAFFAANSSSVGCGIPQTPSVFTAPPMGPPRPRPLFKPLSLADCLALDISS